MKPEKYTRVQDSEAYRNSPLWKNHKDKLPEVDPEVAKRALAKALYPTLVQNLNEKKDQGK